MEKIVNLTPHTINVVDDENHVILTLPSEGVARSESSRELAHMLSIGDASIPVNRTTFGEVQNLPEPQEGVYYVVSAITAKAASGRNDLLLTDDTVRDADGRIIGCRAFAIPG